MKELTKLFGRVLFNFCRFCGHLHLLLDHAFLGDVADNHLDSAVQCKDSHRSGGCDVEQVYFIVTGHWVELWVQDIRKVVIELNKVPLQPFAPMSCSDRNVSPKLFFDCIAS